VKKKNGEYSFHLLLKYVDTKQKENGSFIIHVHSTGDGKVIRSITII